MPCSGRRSPGSASTLTANSSDTKNRRLRARNTNAVNEIPEGLLPERPHAAQHEPDDAELREYNAYLAELAKADNETQHNQNRTTA